MLVIVDSLVAFLLTFHVFIVRDTDLYLCAMWMSLPDADRAQLKTLEERNDSSIIGWIASMRGRTQRTRCVFLLAFFLLHPFSGAFFCPGFSLSAFFLLSIRHSGPLLDPYIHCFRPDLPRLPTHSTLTQSLSPRIESMPFLYSCLSTHQLTNLPSSPHPTSTPPPFPSPSAHLPSPAPTPITDSDPRTAPPLRALHGRPRALYRGDEPEAGLAREGVGAGEAECDVEV